MQYMGGKSRKAKIITDLLNNLRMPGQIYLEPFVGACSIFHKMDLPKIGGDSHVDLVMLLNHVKAGGSLPDSLTKEEYEHYRWNVLEPGPIRGFIGFGCSFGGKWFGGYANSSWKSKDTYVKRDTCLGSKKELLKKVPGLQGAPILNVDYRYWKPKNCLIYCDPPYKGTESYGSQFDHDIFWDVMRIWSERNTVIISEISAPTEFGTLVSFNKTKLLAGDLKTRDVYVENLYMYGA